VNEVSEPEFAVAMQELSADATQPPGSRSSDRVASGITALLSAIHSLNQRVESLEEMTVRNFEAMQFQKIEAHLSKIRDTESANQKLFDSLHQELAAYRDNFLRESLQKPVIRDLLVLFDDLSAIAEQSAAAASGKECREQDARAQENIENALHFLVEILQRLEVAPIEELARVDRTLHRVMEVEATDSPEEDGTIVRRLRRGFRWGEKVFRPEEVG
jgi:molecular chaperone GrpE (heat shock protein)